MGEVYQVKDTRLDRMVAVKVLREHLAKDPERRRRFEREAKAISQLNHPHICTLHDIHFSDGETALDMDYMVLELVEGETLEARLGRGVLSLEEASDVAIAISEALDEAHGRALFTAI